MRFSIRFLLLLVASSALAFADTALPSGRGLEKNFAAPPDSAAPRTWWHWMNGSVTKAGITADLEAMRRVGIRGATIVVINAVPAGPVHFGSPAFFDMVKFAASEAKRLGIALGLENCAGWSSSGGPWVTPDKSMLDVVTSEKTVAGPASFSGPLPQPERQHDFYRDFRVIAFPTLDGDEVRMAAASPTITASVPNFRIEKSGGYRLPYAKENSPQYLQFEFAQPFAARTVVIEASGHDSAGGRIEASDDGHAFHTVRNFVLELEAGRQTYAIPPTCARFYRISFTRSNGRAAAMVIPTVEFLASPRLDNWLLKCDGATSRLPDTAFDTSRTPIPPESMVVHSSRIVDLTSKMDAAGNLAWKVPPGKWTVLRVGYTTNGMTNHPAPPDGTGLECDKLSRTAARAFWDGLLTKVTHDLGPLVGPSTGFTHTLIDSYEVGCQNWTPEFATEFKKRCGYDLLPYLPLYTGRVVDSPAISERVLWDVRRTIADLFAENYYSYFAELAHQHGITLEAEPYGGGPFDDMRSGRDADRVMGEFWWPGSEMGSVKLAASIAHLYGKSIVGAESFTSDEGGWNMSPPTMKALGDRAFTLGINSYTFHRYAMQPWVDRWPGMTMGRNGSNLDRTNTWWEQGAAWLRYVSRCQYLLQQGYFVGDVLAYEGEGSPACATAPSRSELPDGYDFDNCNTDVILHRLAVKDGNLVVPNGAVYHVLLMRRTTKMTPTLLRKLKELSDGGATILADRPEQSPSLTNYPQCDVEVRKLADQLWTKSIKQLSSNPLPTVLADLKVQPDFEVPDPAVKLLYIHRRVGPEDIYFVSNQSDSVQETAALFRVTGKTPEFWHPDTGLIEKVPAFSEENGRTRVPLCLDPTGSIFVVFRDNPPSPVHPVSLVRTDAPATPPAVLEIRSATYGASETADVTAKLTSMIKDGALHAEATTSTFRIDPAPLVIKQLIVDYTLNGVPGTKTIREGGSLDIAPPRPLFPDAQLAVGHAGRPALQAWQSGIYAVTMSDGRTTTVPIANVPQPEEVRGPWSVTFPANWGAPPSATFDKLISWPDSPDSGIKYFSGTATYTKTLSIPADLLASGHRLYLDLGDVQVIAQVTLNNKNLGILWKPPYSVEITRAAHPGDNMLEVKVTNLWPNRIIGDEQLPEDSERREGALQSWPQWLLDGKPSPAGRYTFAVNRHWKKSDPLFPSGLIGPVTLRPSVEQSLP